MQTKANAPRETVSRSRTIAWADPMIGAKAGKSMSGMEYLRAMMDGELPLPPIAMTLGFAGFEAEEGHAVFRLDPAEYHYNPIGVVHGGVTATLLDSAMGCAVQSMLPAGVGYTTLEIKVNFIRPLRRDTGRVRAEGRVIHMGGRSATAEGRLVDTEDTLYAHATTTCMIFRP